MIELFELKKKSDTRYKDLCTYEKYINRYLHDKTARKYLKNLLHDFKIAVLVGDYLMFATFAKQLNDCALLLNRAGMLEFGGRI
jgi:hypothetical protein